MSMFQAICYDYARRMYIIYEWQSNNFTLKNSLDFFTSNSHVKKTYGKTYILQAHNKMHNVDKTEAITLCR